LSGKPHTIEISPCFGGWIIIVTDGQSETWSEGKKEYVMVDGSFFVHLHNEDMGSVDNNDQMIAYYRIKAKTKK